MRKFTHLNNTSITVSLPLPSPTSSTLAAMSVSLSITSTPNPLTSIPLSLRGWRKDVPTRSARKKCYQPLPRLLSHRGPTAGATRNQRAPAAAVARFKPAVGSQLEPVITDAHQIFPRRPRSEVQRSSHNALRFRSPPHPSINTFTLMLRGPWTLHAADCLIQRSRSLIYSNTWKTIPVF